MLLLFFASALFAGAPNWCSYAPNKMIFPVSFARVDFSAICRIHDICYFTIGQTKYSCVRHFLKTFRNTCRDRFGSWAHTVQRNECLAFAEIYHEGLISGLHNIDRRSFNSAQNESQTVLARLNGESLSLKTIDLVNKTALLMAEYEARGHKPENAIEFTVQEILKYRNPSEKKLFVYDDLLKN